MDECIEEVMNWNRENRETAWAGGKEGGMLSSHVDSRDPPEPHS